MKKLLILSLAAVSILASCTGGSGNVAIKTEADSLSNAIGTLMGAQLKNGIKDVKLNSAIVANAIEKVLSAKDMKEVESEITSADNFFRNYMTVIVPNKKLEAGKKFLEDVAKKSNVQKTESGLYYEISEAGDASMKAVSVDTVIVNYKGTYIDGTEFDSSYSRGEPTEFPLDRVIKGWTEGLQLIGKNGKIKLYIPSNLGYGSEGQFANDVLVFEVELLDVKKAK